MNKTCSKCASVLPVTEFHADKARPDGLHTACRYCRGARTSGTRFSKWTEAEIGIVREFYRDHGPKGCKALLEGRTHAAIKERALILGVKYHAPPVVVKPRALETDKTPIPFQDYADAHRAWHDVDKGMRPPPPSMFAAGNLSARIGL